jgi:hypothetical protein
MFTFCVLYVYLCLCQATCIAFQLSVSSSRTHITVIQFRKSVHVRILSHFKLKTHHCLPVQNECQILHFISSQSEHTSLYSTSERVSKFISYLTSGWTHTLSSSSESVSMFVSYLTSSWRHITVFLFRMSAKFHILSHLSLKMHHCTPFQKECPSSHPSLTSVQRCITALHFRKNIQVHILSYFRMKTHHCFPVQ